MGQRDDPGTLRRPAPPRGTRASIEAQHARSVEGAMQQHTSPNGWTVTPRLKLSDPPRDADVYAARGRERLVMQLSRRIVVQSRCFGLLRSPAHEAPGQAAPRKSP